MVLQVFRVDGLLDFWHSARVLEVHTIGTYHRYKIRLLNYRKNQEYCLAPLLGMFFDDFRPSVFDSYVEGFGIDKQVLVTFFRPLGIWTTHNQCLPNKYHSVSNIGYFCLFTITFPDISLMFAPCIPQTNECQGCLLNKYHLVETNEDKMGSHEREESPKLWCR